jgi:hypothetical protein
MVPLNRKPSRQIYQMRFAVSSLASAIAFSALFHTAWHNDCVRTGRLFKTHDSSSEKYRATFLADGIPAAHKLVWVRTVIRRPERSLRTGPGDVDYTETRAGHDGIEPIERSAPSEFRTSIPIGKMGRRRRKTDNHPSTKLS